MELVYSIFRPKGVSRLRLNLVDLDVVGQRDGSRQTSQRSDWPASKISLKEEK